MEVRETTVYCFYLSRILGLAPFLVERNKKGRIEGIRLSRWLCFYSIGLILVMVCLTVRFIIVDAYSKTPIRMRSSTSSFVTIFDVCVVVGACVCGAVSGILGLNNIRSVNEKLKEVDKELASPASVKKDKKLNFYLFVVVFSTMTGMIILDIFSKLINANNYKRKLEAEKKPTNEVRFELYLSFYVLYYILMALHIQLASTVLGIKRRYHRLNKLLLKTFVTKSIDEKNDVTRAKKNKLEVQSGKKDKTLNASEINLISGNTSAEPPLKSKLTTVSRAAQEENYFVPIFGTNKFSLDLPSSTLYGKLSTATTTTTNTITRTTYLTDRLSHTHATLGDAVIVISSTYGLTVLSMLASCLLHLVATAYFLLIELLGDRDLFAAGLQFLWCFFHLSLLLLIVEPCHRAAFEARKTILIVCEILRSCKESTAAPILQRFWRQLVGDRTYYFTANGMCLIDRQILTSIGGAIATYLVILMQFQNSDVQEKKTNSTST